mgnify:CR=1 FL=1
MPENITNFLTDLSDPSSGERSELFRAVRPLLQSPGIDAPKTPYDVARLDKLKDDLLIFNDETKQNKINQNKTKRLYFQIK